MSKTMGSISEHSLYLFSRCPALFPASQNHNSDIIREGIFRSESLLCLRKLLSFTTHLIDSVKLLDNKITPADVEQLQIYFRTATDSPETPGDNGDNQNPTARTRGINPDGHENR